MNIKNISIFNKEGFPINTEYNENDSIFSAKYYFDENSIDTYKTLAFYLLETSEKTSLTQPFDNSLLYLYNDENIYITYAEKNTVITDITKVNNSPLFETKWIHGNNIQEGLDIGDFVYFEGLLEIPKYTTGALNVYQVLDKRQGSVMIKCLLDNSNALPPLSFNDTTRLVGLNIIKRRLNASGFNTPSAETYFYPNKKISIVKQGGSDITTYNVIDITNTKSVTDYYFLKTDISLSSTDKLKVVVTQHDSRIKLNSSSTIFNATGNIITIPYISPLITIGTQIIFEEILTPLDTNNQQTLTVTAINKTANTITVAETLTTETITCDMYLATNKISAETPAIYNYTGLSISIDSTMYNLKSEFDKLGLSNKVVCEFTPDNRISFFMQGAEDILTIELFKVDNLGIETAITDNTNTIDVLCIPFESEHLPNETIANSYPVKMCQIYVKDVDSDGIDLTINGTTYHTDLTGGTAANTVAAFYTAHATDILNIHNINIMIIDEVITLQPLGIPVEIPFVIDFISSEFFYVKKLIEFNSTIQGKLSLTLEGRQYVENFDTDNITTLVNFVNSNVTDMKRYNLNCQSVNNALYIGDNTQLREIDCSVNIGYGNIYPGIDINFYDIIVNTPNLAFIFSNELVINNTNVNAYPGVFNGSVMNITGFTDSRNDGNYNIIMAPNLPDIALIGLSYQGPFYGFNDTQNLTLKSMNTIEILKDKYSGDTNTKLKFRFSDDSDKDAIFFYDFSGEQLTIPDPYIYNYIGPKPLINNSNSSDIFYLNNKPNTDINKIADPTAQQTVFDKLEFNLPFINDININPNTTTPIQLFVGFKSNNEGVSNSVVNGYINYNITYEIETGVSPDSDILNFVYNANTGYNELTISSQTAANFKQSGLKEGMHIEFVTTDNTGDNKNVITSNNSGKIFKIIEVLSNKLVVSGNDQFISESSKQEVTKTTYPYIDVSGNILTEIRTFSTVINTVDQLFLTLDLYGQTEVEDERLKESIMRTGNRFKPEDMFIFKEHDLTETGIDWKTVNIKRKEFIEIQPEIFNYISSYKAVYNALKFFGYEDELTLSEYYININPVSDSYGKLYSHEELSLLKYNNPKWKQFGNSVSKTNNTNYAKTNMFSLVYKLTDGNGNYIEGVSRDDIEIKLFKLKKWLELNVIVNSKLTDITSRINSKYRGTIMNSGSLVKTLTASDRHDVVTFDAQAYLSPLNPSSLDYNVDITFNRLEITGNPIENISVRIKTYNIPIWEANTLYLANDYVFNQGKVWKCLMNNYNTEPTSIYNISVWEETTDYPLTIIQSLDIQKFDMTPISFTINKNIDPHFTIEVQSYTGYGLGSLITKSYSVDYGQWP